MADSKNKLDIVIPVFNEVHIAKLFALLEKDVSSKFRVLLCYDDESDKTLTSYKSEFLISISIKLKINIVDHKVLSFLALKNANQKQLLYMLRMTS